MPTWCFSVCTHLVHIATPLVHNARGWDLFSSVRRHDDHHRLYSGC